MSNWAARILTSPDSAFVIFLCNAISKAKNQRYTFNLVSGLGVWEGYLRTSYPPSGSGARDYDKKSRNRSPYSSAEARETAVLAANPGPARR